MNLTCGNIVCKATKRLDLPFLAIQSHSRNDSVVTEEAKAPASCFGHRDLLSNLPYIGAVIAKEDTAPIIATGPIWQIGRSRKTVPFGEV